MRCYILLQVMCSKWKKDYMWALFWHTSLSLKFLISGSLKPIYGSKVEYACIAMRSLVHVYISIMSFHNNSSELTVALLMEHLRRGKTMKLFNLKVNCNAKKVMLMR